MKVFISSTYMDLVEYRKKAIEVVNRYKCIPLAMEFFNAQSEEPTIVCEKEIRECDIFVGIYAHRYGFIPKGEKKSITQMEYELAQQLKKPCLCFIVDKNQLWKPDFIEGGKKTKLKTFLDVVKKDKTIEFFKNPDDFAVKLSTSLSNRIAKMNGTPVQNDNICLIPRAPYPYMAHPYALPDHFTGRRAEMAALSNWFFNENEPVVVLEAIGGMGKSALSWVWVKKEIIEPGVKVDGVFWWSFYDEPFESFITHLYCYVTGKEAGRSIDLGNLLAVLNHRRFLLVLDGLERALRGYAGMEAMFIQEKKFEGDKHEETEWEQRMREPVHPLAGKFLKALCAGNTKTLITTRLNPVSLEGIGGVKHVFLTGLSEEDTVNFLWSEGINGTRAEMAQAGKIYDFHPLMLKLLATTIARGRAKDITEAYSLNLIDKKEPHKILSTSLKLLSEEERGVVTRAAVFRGVFTFDAIKALSQEMEQTRLWEVMQELRGLGFLFYDEQKCRFDFHPILRSFLYVQLTTSGETGIHDRAAEYFQALPEPQKIVSLEDLASVIELYHHMVKAGKFDEAIVLFRDRITEPTYFQLAAYNLRIDLLKALFPQGEDGAQLPRLKTESAQAWTLNSLANAYALSGQPEKAVPLFLKSIFPDDETNDKEGVAISLGNSAQDQLVIGQLSAAAAHLRKSAAICVEIKDEFREACWRQELGRVLAYRGSASAEEELDKAFDLAGKTKNIQNQGLTLAYSSMSALLQSRLASFLPGKNNKAPGFSLEALRHARQALKYAEEYVKANYPLPRDFVQAYWLLGEALIRPGAETIEPFDIEIPFYDEYFQNAIETVFVTKGNELNAAQRCLHEALRRCRKTNMVEHEPDIMLALARLEFAQNQQIDETLLTEAKEIALRSGYRLKLADIHLFCGQAMLQQNDKTKRLGLTATEHLQETKKYAMDVSELSHLYQPTKSTADKFYKDIPEYDMLKRGMTEEERIRNGYWIAYQIAEILLKI